MSTLQDAKLPSLKDKIEAEADKPVKKVKAEKKESKPKKSKKVTKK